MATAVYECGRHGLRCKHHLDVLAPPAGRLAYQMEIRDLMRCWKGFVRFISEWRAFYDPAGEALSKRTNELTTPELVLVLRVCRDLYQSNTFLQLQARACTELQKRAPLRLTVYHWTIIQQWSPRKERLPCVEKRFSWRRASFRSKKYIA